MIDSLLYIIGVGMQLLSAAAIFVSCVVAYDAIKAYFKSR